MHGASLPQSAPLNLSICLQLLRYLLHGQSVLPLEMTLNSEEMILVIVANKPLDSARVESMYRLLPSTMPLPDIV